MTSLEQALSASTDLMQTEYYAMRLVEEAIRAPAAQWPRELSAVALSPEDAPCPLRIRWTVLGSF